MKEQESMLCEICVTWARITPLSEADLAHHSKCPHHPANLVAEVKRLQELNAGREAEIRLLKARVGELEDADPLRKAENDNPRPGRAEKMRFQEKDL